MSSRPLLTIDSVKINIRNGDINQIDIGGRTDIFNHPEVERYTSDLDGKIVKIQGDLEYKGQGFDFSVSYARESSVHMGNISVTKQGKKTGDLEIREEAFEFLRRIYEDHFVDV